MTTSFCRPILTAMLALSFLSIAASASDAPSPILTPAPYREAKPKQIVSEAARTYLAGKNTETARIWVFFADKGISTKNEFTQKAASVNILDRTAKRRAKMGLNEVVFADLPVQEQYLQQVQNTGGTLRRKSRWLNAASFDIPLNKLNTVAALPFVVRIAPVAGFKTEHDIPLQGVRLDERNSFSQAPDALNYGSSAAQLSQINVPAVHDLGYDGTGVTLAIFDTGFRKTHQAFAQHYLDGRVLGEWDFVNEDGNTANEGGDPSTQWDHGTLIWSVSGGFKDGFIYGPAYRAKFLLAKTEDVANETPAEEDNWVAALEWADSAGADVVTSSLCYSDWYTYADFDGNTATITLAANTAAGLGIVVCNAMANAGPGVGTLAAPADAFNMISVGAVNSTGMIASFSSRGPTADGRTKPEVCARGVSTYSASTSGDANYTTASGTSLSTPLVGGAACLMIQARPTFTPQQVRQAFMETASRATTPDNNYGWGIMNLQAAVGWGANFTVDNRVGTIPFMAHFTATPAAPATSYHWLFGDGDSSTAANPTHTYTTPGEYTVSLSMTTATEPMAITKTSYIAATADTLRYEVDSAYAGDHVELSVRLTNSLPLKEITVPFKFLTIPALTFDSMKTGTRTSTFESIAVNWADPMNRRFAVRLQANVGGGGPDLTPGSGEVLKLYFTINPTALGDLTNVVDTAIGVESLKLVTASNTYAAKSFSGSIKTRHVLRCDANGNNNRTIQDITYLVSYLFGDGNAPRTIQNGDCNASSSVTIQDLTYLVNYLFAGGPAPVNP